MKANLGFSYALCIGLMGCGTVVPEIQDFPSNSVQGSEALVQAILRSIRCELEDGVTRAVNADLSTPAVGSQKASSAFVNSWGAQVALTLTLDEKTTLNPAASYLPKSPVGFVLGGALNGSADATRTDKINYFFTVKDLYLGKDSSGRDNICQRETNPPSGSLLIQSDLKLAEWLDTVIIGTEDRQFQSSVSGQNVISHEVQFDVSTSASVTPSWKLTLANINQSGVFFNASRDRKHDLLITFGPLDPKTKFTTLIPIAENTHILSQEVGGLQRIQPVPY